MTARPCYTQDCSWLTEFIARSPLLRKLEIHRSRVDDTRLLLLATALIDHPSLTEIRLPYNVLGNDAARILARHIDHTGRRVRLVGHSAQSRNHKFISRGAVFFRSFQSFPIPLPSCPVSPIANTFWTCLVAAKLCRPISVKRI